MHELRVRGVALKASEQPIDTATSAGKAFLDMLGVFAEFDRIIDQARATVDDDARMALWHQAEAHLVADQPYTFLLRRKTLAFIDRRIHNVGQTNLGLNLMNVPVEVYVPKGMQRAR